MNIEAIERQIKEKFRGSNQSDRKILIEDMLKLIIDLSNERASKTEKVC